MKVKTSSSIWPSSNQIIKQKKKDIRSSTQITRHDQPQESKEKWMPSMRNSLRTSGTKPPSQRRKRPQMSKKAAPKRRKKEHHCVLPKKSKSILRKKKRRFLLLPKRSEQNLEGRNKILNLPQKRKYSLSKLQCLGLMYPAKHLQRVYFRL